MKQVLKKLPLIVLALVLVLAIKDKTYAATYGKLTYEVQYDGTIKITDCDRSASGALTIPDTIDGKKVTWIGYQAFMNCNRLTSITIPNSITGIASEAFRDCSSLTNITIPDSVISIGELAFYVCESLTNITIPDSVISIGYNAFYYCRSLTSINVSNNSKNYSSIDGVLFNKDKTQIISYSAGKKETSYIIPDSVTSIADYAFDNCTRLTSITIPEGVTIIGRSAFDNCIRLTSIAIPNGVTSIAYGAFNECRSLTNITIPDSVTYIGAIAFYGCSSLTSITIPDSVTSVDKYAFVDCIGLTGINVSDNNKNYSSIDGVLFNKDKTEIIKYPAKKEGPNYDIPNSVTNIGTSAFYKCSSLTSITIPSGVTSIGNYTFFCCSSLKSITIPEKVTSIAYDAFKDCSSLSKVLCLGNAPKLGSESFDRCSSDLKIYAKNGLTGYDANGWENYSDKIVRYDETLKDKSVTFTSRKQTEKVELSNDIFKSLASIKSYEIEDKSIVSVDSSGNVTPLKNGTTNVKAVVQYFDGTKVNLTEKIVVNVKATGVAINPSTWSFVDKYQTPTKKMAAKVQPVDTAFQDVTWKSSNTSIATVDKDGNVKAVGNGTCKIIATTTDGYNKSGSSDVTVDIKAESINLDKTSLDITNLGVKEKIKAEVSPSFSTINRPVKWSSSDTNVAKVDNDGNVTVVGNGACKITATTTDGSNKTASCDVTVDIKFVTGISFDFNSYTITNVNQTPVFRPNITPSDAENKNVRWSSSNTKVATVSSSGVIKAAGNGTCKITATTTDGTNLSASFNITVNIKATKITMDKTKIELTTGKETEKITSSIEPSIANKAVKYTSSNTSIATVSSDGVVTAAGSGTCRIIATTTDGSKVTASCDVTVDIKTTGMKLDKTNYTFNKAETIKINPVITPSKASKKLTWTSSNTKVAIVSSDGKVTPVGKGTCKITTTTTDGTNLSASCNITSNVEYQKGDVNRDGKVNVSDVLYTMNKYMKGILTDEEKVIAEVTGDGKVNMNDVYRILAYAMGKISSL